MLWASHSEALRRVGTWSPPIIRARWPGSPPTLSGGGAGMSAIRQVTMATVAPANTNRALILRLRGFLHQRCDAVVIVPDGHQRTAFTPTRSGSLSPSRRYDRRSEEASPRVDTWCT